MFTWKINRSILTESRLYLQMCEYFILITFILIKNFFAILFRRRRPIQHLLFWMINTFNCFCFAWQITYYYRQHISIGLSRFFQSKYLKLWWFPHWMLRTLTLVLTLNVHTTEKNKFVRLLKFNMIWWLIRTYMVS